MLKFSLPVASSGSPFWLSALLALQTFLPEYPLPWLSPRSPLSSSCSSSIVDTPAALSYDGVLRDPFHPLFLPDLHSVPLGFHSLCGISKSTRDTHITMSGLNCSCKLQTLAHSPVLTADVYRVCIARPCSNSNGRGAAFTDLTF